MSQNVITRFENVSFKYDHVKPILEEANFSVRENSKITIMGQNGAGKSTLFKLITGELKPDSGKVHTGLNASIAIATQVMPREYFEHSVADYLGSALPHAGGDLTRKIQKILDVVHLEVPTDRLIKELSGGQQARLLLAYALIQEPDILLLDEPTNNLDTDGINHLTQFLIEYPKTVLVISHDELFLNSFTDGVLYLDSYTNKIEQYVGDYYSVLMEIEARMERERAKNAQLRKSIQDRKDKVNFFANKGGKMRKLASKLKDQVEEAEDSMVDERREDKTIAEFKIPTQDELTGSIITIAEVGLMINGEPQRKALSVPISLYKSQCLLISGRNGIGKSTFLSAVVGGTEPGVTLAADLRVGYYRQDFYGLDFDLTGYEALKEMMDRPDDQEIYATAARFLLPSAVLKNKVGSFSEGQKGLLCYARFVLQRPGLLIMDEPTNHINFRHIPIIAKALDEFEGALILVSHVPEFVDQIKVQQTLDLGSL